MLSQRAGHCVAVHRGQLDIEQNQRRDSGARVLDATRAIRERTDREPAPLQQEGDQVAVLFVILDQQNGNNTVKELPSPGALSATIVPPSKSVSRRQMASPNPVPSC